MIKNRRFVTVSYLFIAESLVAYLLIYPFANWGDFSFTLLSCLYGAVAAWIVLSAAVHYRKNALLFTAGPLAIVSTTFLTGMHFVASIVVAGVMVWRYVKIDQDPESRNEHFLLITATVLAFAEAVFFRDTALIAVVCLQFVVIIGGFLTAHYFDIDKSTRHSGKRVLPGAMLLFFVSTSLIIFLLPPLRFVTNFIWEGLSWTFFKVVSSGVALLGKMGLNVEELEPGSLGPIGKEKEPELTEEEMLELKQGGEMADQVASATEWGTMIAIVLSVLIALFVLYRFRKRNAGRSGTGDEEVTYQHAPLSSRKYHGEDTRFSFRRSKPDDEVRKSFFRFEKFADKLNLGRFDYEPIRSWFDRIGLDTSQTALYQKVRYGSERLSEEEKEHFFDGMKDLKQQLERKASEDEK